MVAALILAPRLFGGSEDPDEPLVGRTSRGADIYVTVADGKLDSVRTSAAAWCPRERVWIDWAWFARDGQQRVAVEHDGRRFRVAERGDFDAPPLTTASVVMRGELADDGGSARGTIRSRAVGGPNRCEGTVRFSARRRTP